MQVALPALALLLVTAAAAALDTGSAPELVFSDGTINSSRAVTAAGTGSHDSKGDNKVYLRSITALVFSANARTRSRHGGPQPQLSCVGGSAAGQFWGADRYPRVAQCSNIGWDGSSIQWRCEATLAEGLEFGDTTVLCEGFDNPGDEYIFRGSCRLEYTLNYNKYELSFAHVMYGSFLTLAMLWFYWQTRFWLHKRVAKVENAIDRRVARISSKSGGSLPDASGTPTTYGATGEAAYTGQPLQ
jgi:SOCE-associated regulatory factor of calcium homoeostasis